MFEKLKRYWRSAEIPLKRFIMFYAIPALILGFLGRTLLFYYFPDLQTAFIISYVINALPIFLVFVAIIAPILFGEIRKTQIERNMHLFLIRMSVLATSKLPRKKILEVLSEVKEYEALSDEIEKVYKLMEYWNMSLSDAAIIVAKTTPSVQLADFLDRLAHSTDAGEDIEEFLAKETHVVMNQFINNYETALKNLDLVKEIYVAVIISMMFMMVFVSLLPLFMNISIEVILPIVGVVFIIVEVGTLYLIKALLPSDPIWHNMKERPALDRTLRIVLPASYIMCLVLFIVTFLIGLPIIAVLAITVSPLLYPGFLIRQEENKIRKRDLSYDAFMRAVAGYAESSGAGVVDGVGRLSKHDFGELTEGIGHLYKRLLTRINGIRSWNLFASETGSNLISKFTELYIMGISYGGRVDKIMNIISDNFVHLVSVRQKRYQSADAMVGVLYGMTVGIVFTLFSALALMGLLNSMTENFAVSLTRIALPISFKAFNLGVAQIVFIALMGVHSLISSMFIRYVGGGHRHSIYVHFATMVWICAVTALVTTAAVGQFLFK